MPVSRSRRVRSRSHQRRFLDAGGHRVKLFFPKHSTCRRCGLKGKRSQEKVRGRGVGFGFAFLESECKDKTACRLRILYKRGTRARSLAFGMAR